MQENAKQWQTGRMVFPEDLIPVTTLAHVVSIDSQAAPGRAVASKLPSFPRAACGIVVASGKVWLLRRGLCLPPSKPGGIPATAGLELRDALHQLQGHICTGKGDQSVANRAAFKSRNEDLMKEFLCPGHLVNVQDSRADLDL